jgi:Na+-transporting NADH:ubiquinone oxidoreductase subunit NqrF
MSGKIMQILIRKAPPPPEEDFPWGVINRLAQQMKTGTLCAVGTTIRIPKYTENSGLVTRLSGQRR